MTELIIFVAFSKFYSRIRLHFLNFIHELETRQKGGKAFYFFKKRMQYEYNCLTV